MLQLMDSNALDLAQLVNDRIEIADTMYRFAFGLDHGEDCLLDFTAAGRKLKIDFPVLAGRDAVVKTLIPMIGPLDTSHTASNLQIEVTGDTATLHGYLMAQHFMPGDGPRQGSEYALLMNRYDADLVRDGQRWRFKRVLIDNAWADGDPGIITALATHRVVRGKARQRD